MKTSLETGWTRCVVGYVVALGGFFLLAEVLRLVSPSIGVESAMTRQVALKVLMIVAAMVAWAITRRPWSEMGWRKIAWGPGIWPWVAVACAAMAAASMLMLLSGGRHPLVAQLSFLELVLSVWVVSSVGEEIYVRGAMQSWCMAGAEAGADPGAGRAFAPAVVTSAVLFASMHVSLMWMGAGVVGGGIIVGATLFVGWACAILRARTGSLWAAILLHILANVAAVPGGVVGVVIYRIIYGELPAMK